MKDSEHLSINLTGVEALAGRLGDAAERVQTAAAVSARLLTGAGLDPAPGDELAAVAARLAKEQHRLRQVLVEVRSLDDPGPLVVWASPWDRAWAHPADARHAARETLAALRRIFEWPLAPSADVDRALDLLRRYAGNPVFALDLWRLAGRSSDGYGGLLWAVGAARDEGRQLLAPLLQGMGDALATATWAAPPVVTYAAVGRHLSAGVDGDPAAMAALPLLLTGTRPFTTGFLRDAWTDLVLAPNRAQQMTGRAAPVLVEGGSGWVDHRALVLRAVARNPHASVAFVVGADLHGTPNLHRLLGPGVLDGDQGRALAEVIRTAAVPQLQPVASWARLTALQQMASAAAVVDSVGVRAPHIGWHLHPQLAGVLADVAAANLRSFRILPAGWDAAVDLDDGTPTFPVSRSRGLSFLALVFTSPAAEQRVVGAARSLVVTQLPTLLGDAGRDLRYGLGALWGVVTDATVGGRLVRAISGDADRAQDRAVWSVVQTGAVAAVGVVPGGAGAAGGIGQGASAARDQVLPELHLEEQERAAIDALVDERERWLRGRLGPAADGDALNAGFSAAVGASPEPPGYRRPGPSPAEQLEDLIARAQDGLRTGDAAREGVRPAGGPAPG
jgi:hypothetical protein